MLKHVYQARKRFHKCVSSDKDCISKSVQNMIANVNFCWEAWVRVENITASENSGLGDFGFLVPNTLEVGQDPSHLMDLDVFIVYSKPNLDYLCHQRSIFTI